MDNHKKEIIVTIVCSFFVAVTAVVSSIITRWPTTTYHIKTLPSFEDVQIKGYFPLKDGNRWEYFGVALNNTGKDVIEKKIKVVMSVTEVTQGGNAVLFTMKGHPSDAAWALESHDALTDIVEVPASTYGYLLVANKIFNIPEKRLAEVRKSIKHGGFLKPELVSQDDLEFEFPLFSGQAFGSPNQITRADRNYSWQVRDAVRYIGPGNEDGTKGSQYKLVYTTIPDYTEVAFVPYLGIVSFSYHHHGTEAQIDIALQNYRMNVKQ
ncbi:MAG: hypothetical protein ABIG30_01530 [Candidatus Aenigmatarchaeota archaeon]